MSLCTVRKYVDAGLLREDVITFTLLGYWWRMVHACTDDRPLTLIELCPWTFVSCFYCVWSRDKRRWLLYGRGIDIEIGGRVSVDVMTDFLSM